MATENVAGVEKFAPAAASLAVEVPDVEPVKNEAFQTSEQTLEKTGNPDVLGEKLGRNSAGEIEPAKGEIQTPAVSGSGRTSGRNYAWSLTPEKLTDYRIMKYKLGKYFKARSTYEGGSKHDKHICAVAPVYETKNSHKAKATSAAYARQRKSTAGRTRKR